ncbi:Sulfotransferase cytosolic 1B member 1, partial [Biomphalaria glabrata]
THWLWEVTHMLLHQTTEHEKRSKAQVMLESPGGLDRADKEPSPRILNSHNVIAHLPQELIAKKTKIIHVIRNPKDALVSLYWHSKTIAGDDLSFSALLEAVMGDNLNWPSQFDYLQQISEFEDTHPGHPIKHVYYEEMKKDCVKTIKELAEFLNVPASDEFYRNVTSACSFERMTKIEEEHGKQYPEEIDAAMKQMNKEFKIFRKGTIGDWRNHFTVAQNERFEEYITAETTNKQLKFKFIYE